MSLISNSGGSAAALPGTIQLFCGETPDGWKRMNDVYVDKSVFSSDGLRVTLLPYVVTPGAIAATNLATAASTNDPFSPGHMYLVQGSNVRRLDLLTGVSTQCSSFGTASGTSRAVGTPNGLVVTNNLSLWLYAAETDTWARLLQPGSGLPSSFYFAYDQKRNRLLFVSANSAGGHKAYNFATNTLADLPVTLPAASNSGAVVLGDSLLVSSGGSLCQVNLTTHEVTQTEHSYSLGFSKLNATQAFAQVQGQVGGAAALYSVDAEGGLHAKVMQVAGLESVSGWWIPSQFTGTTVVGNNIFAVIGVGGSTANTPVLISTAAFDSTVPVADIFYARKL